MPTDPAAARRLLAGQASSALASWWHYRRIAARAGLLEEVELADGEICTLQAHIRRLCREAGYKQPDFRAGSASFEERPTPRQLPVVKPSRGSK